MRWIMWAALLALVAGCADDAAPVEDDFDGLDDDLEATATTGIIRGVVVDPSIQPLVDVEITLQGTERSTFTNENGAFGFAGLEPNTYFIQANKAGFNGTQTSVDVVAGVDDPPITKIILEPDPSAKPFVQDLYFQGFLACGAAVFYTSVGCTTNGFLASTTESTSIWSLDYKALPMWSQGELVWTSTQSLSGNFIWQIVLSEDPNTPQPHIGHMETTPSPALTYINTSVIEEHGEWILDKGIDYRFFGGPHDLCPAGTPEGVNRFGCGITIEQRVDAFIHEFYNFAPDDGWRFTADGDHPTPG